MGGGGGGCARCVLHATPRVVDLGDAGAKVAINVRKITRQLDGSLLSKPRFVSLDYMSVEKFNFRHKIIYVDNYLQYVDDTINKESEKSFG